MLKRGSLTVFEHSDIPIDDGTTNSLTVAEAQRLTTIGEQRPGFCTLGARSLRVAQYCGVVNLGARTLEILPKIHESVLPEPGRDVLLRMLRIGGLHHVFRDLPAFHSIQHSTLLDVFIDCFLACVARLVKGGLLHEYLEHSDELRIVRGKINCRRQFSSLANRSDVVACQFDELTSNNPWNQLLRAGVRAVLPHIRNAEIYRRAIGLEMTFCDVEEVDLMKIDFARLKYGRQSTRYRTAVQWVELIARTLSPDLRAGATSALGLLIDMNALFERAATELLRRRIAPSTDVLLTAQDQGRFLGTRGESNDSVYHLRPDIVVRESGGVKLVADVKWKRVEVDQAGHAFPERADIYQMLAYASRYPCEELQLIYPWRQGVGELRPTEFRLPGREGDPFSVRVVFLDFSREPVSPVESEFARYWA